MPATKTFLTYPSGLLAGTGTAIGGATADTSNWRTGAAPADAQNMIDKEQWVKFNLVAAGGETIKIQGSRDGANWDDVTPKTVSTGKAASTTLATGEYFLPPGQPWTIYRFVKSAGVALGTCAWAAAPPMVVK